MNRNEAITAVVAALSDAAITPERHVFKGNPASLDAKGTVSIVTGYGADRLPRTRETMLLGARISVVDMIKRGPNNHAEIEDRLSDMVEQTHNALEALKFKEIQSTSEDQIDSDGTFYRAERTIATAPRDQGRRT